MLFAQVGSGIGLNELNPRFQIPGLNPERTTVSILLEGWMEVQIVEQGFCTLTRSGPKQSNMTQISSNSPDFVSCLGEVNVRFQPEDSTVALFDRKLKERVGFVQSIEMVRCSGRPMLAVH